MKLLLFLSKEVGRDASLRIACPVRRAAPLRTSGRVFLQCLPWLLGCTHLLSLSSYKVLSAHATLEVHTRTVELEMPISLARRKDAFHRSLYTDVKTPDGIRLAEPVFSHRREDGSFQLLYNTCPEQDNHSNNVSFDTAPFYGCVAHLLSIAATGMQVGGEKIIDFRDILPESRVVGYWTPATDPVDGQNDLDRVIFAVWAAVCPTAADTCECTQTLCKVSLEQQGTKSAFINYASSSIFTVEKGERLCSGSDGGNDRLGRAPLGRFVYWLVEGTGWVCDLADKHGAYVEFDESHPQGIRVGSILLLQKGEGAAGYDVITLLGGARLDYPFGFNAISVGGVESTSDDTDPVDDQHVAVVVRGRYFDENVEKTEPACFAVAVAKASSKSATRRALKMPCRPCGFAAVLSHPHLEKLLAVCEQKGNPRTLFIDGKAAMTTMKAEAAGIDYPVFVADDFRSWNIVWQNTTSLHESRTVAESVLSTITLSEWNQQLQASAKRADPIEKAASHMQNRHYAAAFGHNSLLLAYQEVGHAAVLAEVALNGSIVNGNSLKVTGNIEGTFLPMSYGDIFMRRREKEVTWYSQWVEPSLADDEPDHLTPIVRGSRQLRLITVKESDETRTACTGAFGRAGTPCDASCHHLQSYEADRTSGSEADPACPFANKATFAETCFEEECSYVTIKAVKTSTFEDGYFAADGNLQTSVKSVGTPSAFEIALQSPSEIWALRGYFVPHGRTEFNVTLLDQKQSIIYTKTTKLSGYAQQGLIFWEWRDILFYRIQYIRLEANLEGKLGEYLELAEFRVTGRELEFCPPEGFFASVAHGCGYRLDFLLKKSEIWDCQGMWSEWSYCDSTCRSTRFLKVVQQALYAGKPCLLFEKKPCAGGPFCNAVNPRAPLTGRQSQDCIFVPSGWSECRGCRRLKINHRAREASGNTNAPCPPVLEIEDCGPPCDSEYDTWKLRGSSAGVFTDLLHVAHRDFVYLAVVAASLLAGATATLIIACTARRTQLVDSEQTQVL